MIGPWVALALLSSAPAIPEGRVRYRVEIAGAQVGFSELEVSCGDGACRLQWRSGLRLPAASGGTLRERRIRGHVDRAGHLGQVEVDGGGARRSWTGAPDTVPLALAELVLAARQGGCIDVLDEETGRRGPACARIEGGRMRADVLGVVEEVIPGRDGFPEAVEIQAQGTRFVRDPLAEVPAEARLEIRVPGPAGGSRPSRFCGRPPDPPAPSVDGSALPEAHPDGSSCREQARAYAAEARLRGLPARVAVGVAHDGQGFVWHAWAEVRTAAGWVPVDPAFDQLPAQGPRFTVARHGGDAAGLAEAGRHILACWGKAQVE